MPDSLGLLEGGKVAGVRTARLLLVVPLVVIITGTTPVVSLAVGAHMSRPVHGRVTEVCAPKPWESGALAVNREPSLMCLACREQQARRRSSPLTPARPVSAAIQPRAPPRV